MEKQRKYIGKWELGCMVFNVCIYKMFTSYPVKFNEISGSAGWITALYTGVIFLIVLFALLLIFEKCKSKSLFELCINKGGRGTEAAVRMIATIYWIISAVYALREFAEVLQTVAYVNSPKPFLIFFFLLGAVVPAVCGARAVYRMHSLLAGFVGIVTAIIAALGFKYTQTEYLAPILGKGVYAVFCKGLSTLFLYIDIFFIFLLMPYCRPEVDIKKTVLTGAVLAVIINTVLVLIFSMTRTYETGGYYEIPIYPLAKSAYFGRFWSRFDASYLAAFITSGMLYLSLALHMISICIGKIKWGKKQTLSGIICLIMCFVLSGCYDSREVEEGAYMIALGIDKGNETAYSYTFQISNPLEFGENSESGEMSKPEQNDESEEEPNKGVNNITIESDDFYTALDQLKSRLGKEPELEHLKLIAFSRELAQEGLLMHSTLLYREREVRPDTKLCLAESARDFLLSVKPELEQSTARYYELLFREENMPYAPVTEIREFVSKTNDTAQDSVIPIAKDKEIIGMGIFHDGKMVAEADEYHTLLYKLLSGKSRNAVICAGDSTFSVTSQNAADISIDRQSSKIIVENSFKANLIHGEAGDGEILTNQLEKDMSVFLSENAEASADILGLREELRKKTKTQVEWDRLEEEKGLNEFTIYVKINIKIERNAFNLQKN